MPGFRKHLNNSWVKDEVTRDFEKNAKVYVKHIKC